MKIAMVSSEANPLVKTGGLGDVVYSLSRELVKMGEEVCIVLPYFEQINKKVSTYPVEFVTSFNVDMSWRHEEAKIYKTIIEGITYYLVSNNRYFSRANYYGEFDDGERFAFFTIAAKNLFPTINWCPDIIHVHDWQAAMLPCVIKEYRDEYFKDTKYVLTIHNPAFQGLLPKSCLGDFYQLDEELYNNGTVRFKDQFSTLKTGIVYADKITTVSPTHRKELLTPEGGMGLDGILTLREYDFSGIVNGIDVEEFNPAKQKDIAKNYTTRTLDAGKKANKSALAKELNIRDDDSPIFSMVSRLTWQKGLDIFYPAAEALLNRGCRLVVLGSGEYQYEQMMEELRRKHPDTCAIYIGYNNDLAHRIYAGSDIFLMPSLFEPCGIGQMIAQRYGTLPLVRMVGGLHDTVECYNGNNLETANGFGFLPYNVNEFVMTVNWSIDNYNKPEVKEALMKNAMKVDNSWKKSALAYKKLYSTLK